MKTTALISVIAHYEIALDLSKNVPKMEGFAAFWVRNASPADRRIIKQYHNAKQRAFEILATYGAAETGRTITRDETGKISAISDPASRIQNPASPECPTCEGRGHDQGSISRKCEDCNGKGTV